MESLYHVRNELSVDPDGCWLRGYRLLIPFSFTDRVVQLAHIGQQGMVKTKSRLQTKVWFPLMDERGPPRGYGRRLETGGRPRAGLPARATPEACVWTPWGGASDAGPPLGPRGAGKTGGDRGAPEGLRPVDLRLAVGCGAGAALNCAGAGLRSCCWGPSGGIDHRTGGAAPELERGRLLRLQEEAGGPEADTDGGGPCRLGAPGGHCRAIGGRNK
ncbi:hypothetical protein NDU88_003207 [Pleurodeles waltl]|uniref:Uncharacterized protein n=1 Tax=Pleurodeles waltl TaxID=8319 RepID=A0AAV7SCT0_PLEWA|nr:hypothetical protein NDU88_003207 [Pleurodeles waltl]